MKVKPLFTQTLAMVGHVEHRGVHTGSSFKRIDDVSKHLVGIAHGVVISVVELFFRATFPDR